MTLAIYAAPPGSRHAELRQSGDDLRIVLRPSVAEEFRFVFFLAGVGAFAWWQSSNAGPGSASGRPAETTSQIVVRLIATLPILGLLFAAIAAQLFWLPFGRENLLFSGSKLKIDDRIFGLGMGMGTTDEFEIALIRNLRYEPKSGRWYRHTICFEHMALPFAFGKNLTESEARWLIDLIQSQIDRLKSPCTPSGEATRRRAGL
jgi:hypothetical protein